MDTFKELKANLQKLITSEGGYYNNRHITIQVYAPYDQTPQTFLVLEHGNPLARLSFYDNGEIRVYPKNTKEPDQILFSTLPKISEDSFLPNDLKHAVDDFFRDFRFPIPIGSEENGNHMGPMDSPGKN